MERIPVLLDTDPGSDIDDAVCLAYLLHKPECELLGVTTVSGDVRKRAAIVEVVCRASGREDVPIHCGRSNVLVKGPGQAQVPHYEAIRDIPHLLDRPENAAVHFLRDTIRSRPGEIVLLSIGPYSNIGLLFALDPEIPFLLRGLVSMGGRFFSGDNKEWNAICDPVATAITYAAPRRDHVSVGLDVTLQCTMPAEQVRERFVGEPLATVLKMAEKWFEHTGSICFHDPLAASLIFHPELCTYESGRVEVSADEGVSTLHPGEGPDRVAKTVDAEAFFKEYFSVF
jgi:purine nucleosidase